MRIGVICEGHSDRAVISNILTGATGLDRSDIEALRPIYSVDETDKSKIDPLTFGSWSLVKSECEKRDIIDGFLSIDGQDFIVIHLDSAEAEEYGVVRPKKNRTDYAKKLREAVIKKINEWLVDDLSNELLYAVAIEEIDAWVLTVYEQRDSTKTAQPKERLSRVLAKKRINSSAGFDNYMIISKPLSKKREIAKGEYLRYNLSLEEFYQEVLQKVVPKIQ